jgi:hypothetical protein
MQSGCVKLFIPDVPRRRPAGSCVVYIGASALKTFLSRWRMGGCTRVFSFVSTVELGTKNKIAIISAYGHTKLKLTFFYVVRRAPEHY